MNLSTAAAHSNEQSVAAGLPGYNMDFALKTNLT